VLETHPALDEPALNYSQLCMFGSPGTNSPVPEASTHLSGSAAPRSQKQARAGGDDTRLHNCLGTSKQGPLNSQKADRELGWGPSCAHAGQLCFLSAAILR